MKKNGFTLVELIAVIAILGILMVMFIPSLLSGLNNNKNNALNKIYDLIETGARNYVVDYNIKLPVKLKVEDLCETYIECPIINPVTNEELNDCVAVRNFDGVDRYTYEICSEVQVPLTVELNGGETTQKFEPSYSEFSRLDLVKPTYENNEFEGWEVVKGNSIIDGNTLIIGNTETIINAMWRTYAKLTLDLDGGESGQVINEQLYKSGANIILIYPKKEGYIFSGWELIKGDGVLSGYMYIMGREDTEIKAIWTKEEYTITYNLNGGTLSKIHQRVEQME